MSDSSNESYIDKNEEASFDVQATSNTVQERQIAEAAYYRAEKRGFEPGHEMDDWFNAEEEILSNYTD